MTRARRRPEAGFGLVGAVAGITIMLVLMGMAVPAWRYVMQDEREEELIFRGGQIADAITAFQKKNANALPVSLEILVKGKFLRKAYADPMTKDGKWRLVHPGEVLLGPMPQGRAGNRVDRPAFQAEGAEHRAGAGGTGPGGSIGPILGVASMSKEKSLRLFNGRSRYDQWIFAVGMPRIVGKPPVDFRLPGSEKPGLGKPARPGADSER